MLNVPVSTKVFLCTIPIDMRQSFDGLSGHVQSHFEQNPLCGNFFVFLSKRRDRMKILFWNIDGFVLYYKRLERGTFSWIGNAVSENAEISASEFALLLSGINPVPIRQPKRGPQSRDDKPLLASSAIGIPSA